LINISTELVDARFKVFMVKIQAKVIWVVTWFGVVVGYHHCSDHAASSSGWRFLPEQVMEASHSNPEGMKEGPF